MNCTLHTHFEVLLDGEDRRGNIVFEGRFLWSVNEAWSGSGAKSEYGDRSGQVL